MRSKHTTKSKKLNEKLLISDKTEVVLKNYKGQVIDACHIDNIDLRTIKNLEIEISSSQSDDETLLHQLLNKTCTQNKKYS